MARPRTGITVSAARKFILSLGNVTEGTSYGYPSFLLNGKFFARFRDDNTVLALRIRTIDDRDVLMQMNDAFFVTDHYRDYPAVLIRLADVPAALFKDVVKSAWEFASKKRKK